MRLWKFGKSLVQHRAVDRDVQRVSRRSGIPAQVPGFWERFWGLWKWSGGGK